MSLIIPLLLLLPIFSILTGFARQYPTASIIYSTGLLIYLLLEAFFYKGKKVTEKTQKSTPLISPPVSAIRVYEILGASVILAGVISHVSKERWPHLFYFPLAAYTGIKFELRYNLFVLLLIGVVESPHLSAGDDFELVLNGLIFLTTAIVFLLTWNLKKAKLKAEFELSRIRDKAEMYNMQSLEEEDLIAYTLQHSTIHELELSELAQAIKDSLYADGVHIFAISPSGGNLLLRHSTDNPVLYRAGIIQRVAEEGISRLLTLDSKNLSPGYAVDYEISSLIAIPLKQGKAITGVLVVDSLRRHAFNDGDLEIMERYGRIISSALLRQNLSFQRERAERLIKLLHEETARLTTTIRQEELCSLIVESCHRVFPSSLVSFIRREGKGFIIFKEKGPDESKVSLQIKPNFVVSNPFYSLISEEKKFLYISRLRNEDFTYLPFYAKNASSLLTIPLWYEHELSGLIVILSDRPGAFKQEQIEFLRVYANQAAIALQNARLYKEIENMATTDGLTGLFNHRKFQEELERELKRHERAGKPLCLCLCDIDFFKKINDTYGHPAGDAVLKGVAGIIKETVRSTDIPARYGGEEFAIILIETPIKEARLIAERLRKKIESHKFTYKGSTIKATLSLGIASFHAGLKMQKSKLIENADKALYYAKHNGRNQTILWEEVAKQNGILH